MTWVEESVGFDTESKSFSKAFIHFFLIFSKPEFLFMPR